MVAHLPIFGKSWMSVSMWGKIDIAGAESKMVGFYFIIGPRF